MRYAFIRDNAGHYEVDELCEALRVERSGYYSWRDSEASERKIEDARLKIRIVELHQTARGRYGHRPIYHHLLEEDAGCGRDRTLRLMREMGLSGDQSPRYKPLGTNSNHLFGYSPNLLKEFGQPTELDEIWVADTTYLLTTSGWNYLATVMDLCSRRVIGWSVSDHNDTDLVCAALKAAMGTRGQVRSGIIHHSDRGGTYASDQYQRQLEAHGMQSSMSGKGNCYDNAAMESFYGRYKSSSVRDSVFNDQVSLRANVFEYIEIFYNRFRKHSSLGYKSPVQFEEAIFPPMGGKEECTLRCDQLTSTISN